MATNRRDDLIKQAWSLEPGQCVSIPRFLFNEAFPPSPIAPLGDPRPPEDRFLEQLPGVNYGTYRLDRDPMTGDYILSRHECGTDRVRRDWDRR